MGLHSLQHRGQEGAGIVVSDEDTLKGERGLGLLTEAIKEPQLNKQKMATMLLDMFVMRHQEIKVSKISTIFISFLRYECRNLS